MKYLIITIVLLLIGWFYWFQWRPSEIKKNCALSLMKAHPRYSYTNIAEDWVKICEKSKGL